MIMRISCIFYAAVGYLPEVVVPGGIKRTSKQVCTGGEEEKRIEEDQ